VKRSAKLEFSPDCSGILFLLGLKKALEKKDTAESGLEK